MTLIESRLTTYSAYAMLVIASIGALFPIALLLLNAFKTTPEIMQSPLGVPDALRWENFSRAWVDARFATTFFNSVMLTGATVLLVCATSSATAYVLARKKITTWKIISAYLLATTTAPIQLFLFPLYFGFARLGIINNVLAVSVIYTAIFSPFAIMLLRTYFLAVPRELEEAALVDGATHWQVFTKVMLPIVSPGILTVALIVGLHSWNEFLVASTFLQSKDQMTAVFSFYLLSGKYSSDWGEIMAAALLIVLPVVILFVFLQRHFIEGMAGGSVKG